MQKGHLLQFTCQNCQHPIEFSLFELDQYENKIACGHCQCVYDFNDETLKRQIKKFNDLCYQIQQSEEILSQTNVGIYIGDREIKIPYKILLSRLNSSLDLMVGEKILKITFRIEPTRDLIIEK